MHKTWSGTLSFGLVNVPVGLAKATVTREGYKTLHKKCGTPVNMKRVCPLHGDIDWNDVSKGYEVRKGQYVKIEQEELELLAPESSRNIEVMEFVPLDQVNMMLVERTYYLIPDKEAIGARAYALFLRALEKNRLAAVVKFNLWGKENLGLVTGKGNAMTLGLLYYAEDMADASEIEERISGIVLKPAELKLANEIIGSLKSPVFTHKKFSSNYRLRVKDLLTRKAEGRAVEIRVIRKKEQAPVGDLMEALKASVASLSGNGKAKGKKKIPA